MTNLIVVRHGYSESNKKDLFVGHGNVNLTEQGHQQAELTAKYLDSVKIDVIYSSDLDRAIQTAEHTAIRKNLPINKNPNLREIYAGDWEFKAYKDILRDEPEVFSLWKTDVVSSYCTGGETFIELQTRVYNEIEKLCKLNDGKTIAVFSHGSSIRSFIAKAMELDRIETNNLEFPANSSVSSLIYENGKFTLVEYSKCDFMGDVSTTLVI